MAEHTSNKFSTSLQRFESILTENEMSEMTALQEQPLPTGIRLNSLTCNPETAIFDLAARYGWQVQPIPFCEHGWTIQSAAQSPGTTIEHRMGRYYIQDAASMVPVSLFEFKDPQPLILDMAASPGGKTTHLIDRTQDQGFILANDTSKSRIPALRSVLTTWGGINQAITQFPGESFGEWFPETFDAILLDAPCSMENLRPTSNHPLRETTADERTRLQERQIQLLISGLQSLKVGGQLVYATCSLAPEEDEAVIDAVLNNFPHAFQIEDVSSKFTFSANGLVQFHGETYHPELQHSLRLWPHQTGMSGFFCALVTKQTSIPGTKTLPPNRDFAKTGLTLISPEQQNTLAAQLADDYGIDLNTILQQFNLDVLQRNDMLFFIPLAYLKHFASLPYEFIGLLLGKWLDNRLQSSHEFVSRFGQMFTNGKIVINESEVPQWIAGRDIRHPDTHLFPQGQYLMVSDAAGRNLGMGKLLSKRLRNLLRRKSI